MRLGSSAGEYAEFHQGALLAGIWLLVVFVGIHTMSHLRAILEPLLWAFFLMMALVPMADAVEWLILQIFASMAWVGQKSLRCCKSRHSPVATYASVEVELAEAGGDERSSVSHQAHSAVENDDRARTCVQKLARMIAVISVLLGFFGLVSLFFATVFESAQHMQSHWKDYEDGAKRIVRDLDKVTTLVSQQVPQKFVEETTEKALKKVEEVLSSLLGAMVENVTSTLMELVMVLLYMLFWLCNPIDIHDTVAILFKRYILLKSMASAVYATCVWFLLHMLGVDLSVVFGLVTFLFNFVPEIGPMIAALLPAPVVLLDVRQERPWLSLGFVILGQVALKFVFANIVEVLLIERQRDMKMHPVVILFFLAFFGWIWGATGMLLSVPIMAAAKASMHALPPAYRDPLLIVLEGDRTAPQRYDSKELKKHVDKEQELLDQLAAGKAVSPYVLMNLNRGEP